MRLIRLPALLVLLLLSGCQATLLRGVGVLSGGTAVDVRSAPLPGVPALALDRYEPRAAPRACVVFFYGGSWRSGERGWYRFVGRALAERGYRVLIPDYRKAPRFLFPSFMEDAARAVAEARRTHCQDPDGASLPMFLSGHSAGAHIAALLATDARYLAAHDLHPRQLAGVVGLAGPYDFLPMTAPDVIEVFRGDPNLHDSQPIHFVDGDEPPMQLIHGEQDRTVYPKNSRRLAEALRERGVRAELSILPDAGHVGLLLSLRPGSRQTVLDTLAAFIDERAEAASAKR